LKQFSIWESIGERRGQLYTLNIQEGVPNNSPSPYALNQAGRH